VGDLSYADTYPFDYQVRWDTWSRLIEGSAAYQPWIWTSGNHDIEFLPQVVCGTNLGKQADFVSNKAPTKNKNIG